MPNSTLNQSSYYTHVSHGPFPKNKPSIVQITTLQNKLKTRKPPNKLRRTLPSTNDPKSKKIYQKTLFSPQEIIRIIEI